MKKKKMKKQKRNETKWTCSDFKLVAGFYVPACKTDKTETTRNKMQTFAFPSC